MKPITQVDTSQEYFTLHYKPTTSEIVYGLGNASTPGIINMFAGASAPLGYLLCNGAAVSRTTYANLFAVIGTTYGNGDGVTTFNVPNFNGRVPVGQDSSTGYAAVLGQIGGEPTHTLTTGEMPVHNHGITDPGHTHSVTYSPGAYADIGPNDNIDWGSTTTGSATTGITVNNAGSGQAHNNLQPYLAINYIISY